MIIPTQQREHYLNEAEKELIKEQTQEDVWDPTNKVPNTKKLIEENKKTKAQQLYIEDNIDKIKKRRKTKTTIISILAILATILYYITKESMLSGTILFTVIAGIIIISIVYKVPNVNKIKKDIIKLEVAKRNKYLYSPNEDTQRYNDYRRAFPQAFQRGDRDQNIEDIFWGKIKKDNKEHQFTTGVFNYKRMEGTGKNRRLVTYLDHYFAIKLDKKVNTDFALIPNNTLFGNFFSQKKITTESKKFNDIYKITTKDKKEHTELEITRILTPRVQEELIKFNEHTKQKNKQKKILIIQREEKAKGTTIIINNDTILFYIPGPLIKNMKTKFRKNMKILDEDINAINKELNTLINISTEIVKYIN